MPDPTSDRLQQLLRLHQREPRDTFVMYGLGMEYRKLGAPDQAIAHFDQVLAVDPGYCYAYYQKGQVCEQLGKVEQAKQAYQDGIIAAKRVGDAHAQSELETALSML